MNTALQTKNDSLLCGAFWTIAHLCQSQLGSEVVREYQWIHNLIDAAQRHHNYLVRGIALSALGFSSSSHFVRYLLYLLTYIVYLNFSLVRSSLKLLGAVRQTSQLFHGI